MFENFPIPASFSLVHKGKVFLLLKDEYKDILLEQGIEHIKTFIRKHRQTSQYVKGRALHPSIPLKEGKRIVVRQHLHGGLLRVFTRDLYFSGSRSFEELALTVQIRDCGISTAQPIGAIHQTFGPFYKAYLLSLEIPGAKDLIQYFQEMGAHPSREPLLQKRRTIRSAGQLIHHLHASGFFHQDLQLKNILVSGDQLFLIDFDRSYHKRGLTAAEKKKNLLRLDRSMEKWERFGLPISRTDRLRFLGAYAEKDEEMRKAMVKILQTCSSGHLFHRWGWAIQRVLKRW